MSEYNPNNSGQQYTKVDSVNNNPLPQNDTSRVLPRQVSTGSTRGTQTIGYGGIKLDGSNNTITIDGDIGGFNITNNDVTFLSLTKDGIILNDGTNNRVLIGYQKNGFS